MPNYETEAAIIKQWENGVPVWEIAEMFGISVDTVYEVIEFWGH